MSVSSPSPALGFGTAFLGFALYATHDAITKHLGADYSVFQIIFFAMLFAFVPTSLMVLGDKAIDNFRPRYPWLVLLRSCLSLTALSCAFYAFTHLPLAEVYSLLFATPLLITIFSIPLLGEVVRLQRWMAVIVGLIGVLIVLRPGTSELTLGHFAAMASSCASAMGNIVIRKIGSQERSAVLILYPMLLSLVVMGSLLPNIYVPVQLPDLGLMALLGFFSVTAQFCVILGYRAAPAAVIAPMQYSQIIWATIFGYFFFNETPDIFVGVGSSIIIASGLFIVWRESQADVSAQRPVLRMSFPKFGIGGLLRR
ncbi:DMT family transporter [Roseibium suaedae]|uniref:S-adenosylmethionine uptake transporter n=1 Tax=Roseibium suaedae TaxID=735517 RepID=A0A1M7GL66_9HYPH|nr:DMT family transporter [Roseibium suaedae]SHM16905.1 S-adenosylmethionine uptake transporter [Roseibium suaedae]